MATGEKLPPLKEVKGKQLMVASTIPTVSCADDPSEARVCEFCGSPIVCTSKESAADPYYRCAGWNSPSSGHWDAVYRVSPPDTERRPMWWLDYANATETLDVVVWYHHVCRKAGCASPHVLEAGCGASLYPQFFAHMGASVTAMDGSEVILDYLRTRKPVDEEEVAKALGNWIPVRPEPDQIVQAHFPAEPWERFAARHHGEDPYELYAPEDHLRRYKGLIDRTRGEVQYTLGDWCDPNFPAVEFDVIHIREGLSLAPPEFWQPSIRSFISLLSEGGLLLIEQSYAYFLVNEVRQMLEESGFLQNYDEFAESPHRKKAVVFWT